MNTNFRDSEESDGGFINSERRTCPVCGTTFATRDMEFCPACMLRRALLGGVQSDEPSSEVKSTQQEATKRFEHYELVINEDGQPLELGRGAMGVTYKAFDINLHCPVTLKVIKERYLGDAAAQLRFLREARAAASVRHPNVASVFHLGRTGENYFYAMEFVEGETLQNLIKRSGRLGLKSALEITAQVAVGLAAVHKQGLVHRDIKPSNIMVRLEDEGAMTAKIIDLGLAKAVSKAVSQTTISTPGGFAGTPEYASPEQFAGVDVDIRSDLYSLGVILWEMLTGHGLFRGSPAEVMRQRQHAQLPSEQLEGVPQPIAVLLEVLLNKDPRGRFQTPAELLKAMPMITDVIDRGQSITPQSVQQMLAGDPYAISRHASARLGPEKISIARLPITGCDIFGREEDIAFLNRAWTNPDINIATIVAWAGVGKTTLVNHWLRRMAAQHYRSAELVFGWSFYNQGSSGDISCADEFLSAALAWFGDPGPHIGTAWEKGERLAGLIAHRRVLLVLDGLEPLQYPPGPREGRLAEPSLQALLRELAASNTGLCVVTTRLPVADIADHEHTSAPRRDLEHLSNDAGASVLRALGVKGNEAELQSASQDFSGHCLALTLLGSYLTDAYDGDVRSRGEVSERLTHDMRQGVHARKVMESYQTWFGEGPELSILRILGLFDRPVDELTLGVLLKPPMISDLTESLTNLTPVELHSVLTKLRRAKLLANNDPHKPGYLDVHPLVRDYFGEQFRNQLPGAWRECNRRLYNYYRTLAPQLPDNFKEMEPLFLAVICGCNVGLLRDALHEVYLPRIQRGHTSFAANVLGARGVLLSVLVHFFENESWGSPTKIGLEGQRLTEEDELLILTQAGTYLTYTRGLGAPEAGICYRRAQSLCQSVNRPLLLYSALIGQWRYSFVTEKLTATMEVAKRIHSLAQEQNNPSLMMGACLALAGTHSRQGDFETARHYAVRGVNLWRAGGLKQQVEVSVPVVNCLCYEALSEWHFGEVSCWKASIAEAISLAKTLNDMVALAVALFWATILSHFERDPAEVERTSSDLIELSTRHSFAFWLAGGEILRGWARSASGSPAEGLLLIEDGIRHYRATGSALAIQYWLALKAEALHLADRTFEALEAVRKAQTVAEKFEERWWCAELPRLRGVFLAAIGGDRAQIEDSFLEAIRTAKQQKSISLMRRAQASQAEYRRLRS